MGVLAHSDPRWITTLPRRVAPRQDEWLLGLLLRCDEVNHWGCRATLTLLLSPGSEKFHRCWRTTTPYLVVIQPFSLNLDFLAQLLALSTDCLVASTYHRELARLYDKAILRPRLLGVSFTFHLCPVCISESRLLRRTLTLPHITHCQEHQVTLLSQCRCGAPLSLFRASAQPFLCSLCGLDWADLPRIEATPSHMAAEQKFLTWYEFFFSQGTTTLLRFAVQLMTGSSRKRLALGDLVVLLVKRGYSPQDILSRVDRAPL